MLLFGAAAAGLVARRRYLAKKGQAAKVTMAA
jgi:hypothetical protein